MFMKRIISLLLVAVMLFAVTSCGSSTAKDFEWTYKEGILTISGTGKMPDYSDGNGEMTTRPWEDKLEEIEEIVVEEGITRIGDYAFYGMKRVVDVTVPASLESIGKEAFRRCITVNDIVLGDKLKEIEDGAFGNCNSLYEVYLPSTVKTVGANAFKGCLILSKITVPAGVDSIGEDAFANCKGLEKITYKGTKAQWEAYGDGLSVPAGVQIKCSDEIFDQE